MSENIVHMVLAKVCAADGSVPVGVKGISLFVVPKNVEDGVGGWVSNDVTLVGLNHKMGYRGITNCVMSFGENGACRGELLGEEGKGNVVWQRHCGCEMLISCASVVLCQAWQLCS